MRLLLLAVWLAMPLLSGCATTTVDTAYENRDYAQPWLTPDWGETGIGGTHTTHRGK
ncbi:hypothetical protein [Pseudaminobacter salicylatoxidans]|uniref:hypothetical protein n=1 Tax=Pseudaminobacter salicylatoxidans TaxID=93369 RepID=UPI0012F66031|nr:hypothetical protein [Pseudaminobacter salicylatoxidans]